jgi:hypothetical protein
MNRYSRLTRLEEKRNVRSAVIYVLLTLLLIVFLLYFGLPTTAKIAGFLADLRGSSLPVDLQDTTPPAPPTFEPLDEFTQKAVITVKGRAEPGVKLMIYLNEKLEEELVVDASGNFAVDLPILGGENTLYALAQDESGNQSNQSKAYTITYDKKAPDLTISEPADGASFSGTSQKQIAIKGTTEEEAQVMINGRFASVKEGGSFEFPFTLSEGQNNFEVVSKDQAGNETKKTFSVSFTP